MSINPDYALFALIAQSGSVSAAGRALGISAPMASKRLMRLEERLGTRLLYRTTRRVVLTTAGAKFYEDVTAILNAVREAEARLTGEAQALSGRLRITAPTSFGRMHIAPHLDTFLRQYPSIHLELNLSDSFSDLMSDEFDLAVRIAGAPSRSLTSYVLAPNRRILCASPSYLAEHGSPVTLRDLGPHRLLAAQGQTPWRMFGPEGDVTVEAKSWVATNSSEVIRELAIAGVGIALRSLWDVSEALASGALVRVLERYEGTKNVNILAVHPATPFVPQRILAFVGFLRALYQPNPPWVDV